MAIDSGPCRLREDLLRLERAALCWNIRAFAWECAIRRELNALSPPLHISGASCALGFSLSLDSYAARRPENYGNRDVALLPKVGATRSRGAKKQGRNLVDELDWNTSSPPVSLGLVVLERCTRG